MKNICRNLLELAMNCEDFRTKEGLEEEVRNLLDTLQDTFNCPSNWQDIKEELIEEYQDDNDALNIIEF